MADGSPWAAGALERVTKGGVRFAAASESNAIIRAGGPWWGPLRMQHSHSVRPGAWAGASRLPR